MINNKEYSEIKYVGYAKVKYCYSFRHWLFHIWDFIPFRDFNNRDKFKREIGYRIFGFTWSNNQKCLD